MNLQSILIIVIAAVIGASLAVFDANNPSGSSDVMNSLQEWIND